jgi:hypothetical protein
MRLTLAIALTAGLCAMSTACDGLFGHGAPVATTSPRATAAITASDAENGGTIIVRIGDRLTVTLHSTYWSFAGSSNADVIAPDGLPTVSPMPSGCVPGQGCGKVVAAFDAIAVGTSEITATRITCGEALRCTGSAGSYRVTVVVRLNA